MMRETPLQVRETSLQVPESPLQGRKSPLQGRNTPLQMRETPLQVRKTSLQGRETVLQIARSIFFTPVGPLHSREVLESGKTEHRKTPSRLFFIKYVPLQKKQHDISRFKPQKTNLERIGGTGIYNSYFYTGEEL